MAEASGGPIVMLNLLEFRSQAAYPDGRATTLTGRQAHELYATATREVVEKQGGRFLFAGDVAAPVVRCSPVSRNARRCRHADRRSGLAPSW